MIFQLEKRKNLHDAVIAIIAFASATLVLLDLFGCEGMEMSEMGSSDADMDADSDTDSDTDSDDDPISFEGAIVGPTVLDECDTESQTILAVQPYDTNAMASPALSRFLISMGQKVDRRVRPNEFLNYYEFGYEAPPSDHVSVEVGMAAGEITGRYDMQVGIRAPEATKDTRDPFNLTLAIDTSESMAGVPIQRAKQCCIALAGSLKQGDVVSITTLDPDHLVILSSHQATGPQDPEIISHCNAITTGGEADLYSGLSAAYQVVHETFDQDRTNAVILVSDGAAEIGATSTNLVLESADDSTDQPIHLMGVQVGDPNDPEAASESLMRTVTDAGKGAYIFVDSASEASAMFTDRLMPNLEIAASNVRLEIDLPPAFQVAAFYGEGVSTDPNGASPQHLGANGEIVFHLTLQSCAPEALDPTETIGVSATYEDPGTGETRSSSWEGTVGQVLLTQSPELTKGSAIVAYATALETTRSVSGDQAAQLVEEAIDEISGASLTLGGDQDLDEIVALLEAYLDVL